MSASTLSVTANPRRRPSPITGVKQSIEIINDASNIVNTDKNGAAAGDGGGDGKNVIVSKDLSNSEKSKDKKSSQLPNSSATIRTRTRKGPQKNHPKPRWLTVVSVLSKNLLLVVVLVGLIQMVRKLVVNSGNVNLLGFSDISGRISRVESSVNTIAKMLQVEVDVVERKMGSEVGNLRNEINRIIEERIGEIDKSLKRLEEKSEGFEASLDELRSREVLSKDDFVRLYDEWKKSSGNVEGFGVSFDEIKGLAREIVEMEMEKHVADGLGRVDFAVASGGGAVVDHSEPLVSGMFGRWLAGSIKNRVHNDALKMLTPSFGEPAQCFPLKGSSGYVVIRLRAAIVPEAVTLEHVAKSVAYDRSSAPKHCRVSGFLVGKQGFETQYLDTLKKFDLANFIYDLEKSHAQTFDVLEEARSSVIDSVLLEFSSNYGSSTHTCIYRFRVHGHEPKSITVVPADS